MSPALNRSSAIRYFEGSDVIEICDGITFDFYTGLQQMMNHISLKKSRPRCYTKPPTVQETFLGLHVICCGRLRLGLLSHAQ